MSTDVSDLAAAGRHPVVVPGARPSHRAGSGAWAGAVDRGAWRWSCRSCGWSGSRSAPRPTCTPTRPGSGRTTGRSTASTPSSPSCRSSGWLLNTFVFAGGTTVLLLLFDSLCAYALARLRFRGRNCVFWLVLAHADGARSR